MSARLCAIRGIRGTVRFRAVHSARRFYADTCVADRAPLHGNVFVGSAIDYLVGPEHISQTGGVIAQIRASLETV